MIRDEPSSNLDWKAISELKNIISLWKSQGKTVIISEHRLWYLAGLVDRVLFDELTSGLDYAHMTSVAKLLKQLSAQGRTVIVSTHDPELIALCCVPLNRSSAPS